MFCIKCGKAFADGERFCPACGARAATNTPQSIYVPNHMVWAVLATIFFSTIFGIVAIIYSAQVNGYAADGKTDIARRTASTAAVWIWVSIAFGILSWLFWILFFAGAAVSL